MPGGAGSIGGGGGGFDYGSAIGAVGDLFSGIGSFFAGQQQGAALGSEAAGFGVEAQFDYKAAEAERLNESLINASGAIQGYQEQRKTYLAESNIGAQQAGAGFSQGGSGGDILRNSAEQGGLATQLIGTQTAYNFNNAKLEEESYTAQGDAAMIAQRAALAAASSAGTSGVLGAIGGVLGFAAKAAPIVASFP